MAPLRIHRFQISRVQPYFETKSPSGWFAALEEIKREWSDSDFYRGFDEFERPQGWAEFWEKQLQNLLDATGKTGVLGVCSDFD